MIKSTDCMLNINQLNFEYDPIGSRKKGWDAIDRDFLLKELCEFLVVSEAQGYEYLIFGKTFIKRPSDITLCFDNGEHTTFVVSSIEKGRRQDIALHSNVYFALADFLFRTLRKPSYEHSDIFKMIRRIPV